MYPVYYGNELLLKLCGKMGRFYTVAANANGSNCFESWSAFPKNLRLRVPDDPTTDFFVIHSNMAGAGDCRKLKYTSY